MPIGAGGKPQVVDAISLAPKLIIAALPLSR